MKPRPKRFSLETPLEDPSRCVVIRVGETELQLLPDVEEYVY